MDIHRYVCANPVECIHPDKKMRKFWQKNQRNWDGYYMMASYLQIKMNINDKIILW